MQPHVLLIQETHRLYLEKLDEISKLQNISSASISRQRKRLKDMSNVVKKYTHTHTHRFAWIYGNTDKYSHTHTCMPQSHRVKEMLTDGHSGHKQTCHVVSVIQRYLVHLNPPSDAAPDHQEKMLRPWMK